MKVDEDLQEKRNSVPLSVGIYKRRLLIMRNVDHVHALVADACVYVDVRLRMITQRHNLMSSNVLSTLFLYV